MISFKNKEAAIELENAKEVLNLFCTKSAPNTKTLRTWQSTISFLRSTFLLSVSDFDIPKAITSKQRPKELRHRKTVNDVQANKDTQLYFDFMKKTNWDQLMSKIYIKTETNLCLEFRHIFRLIVQSTSVEMVWKQKKKPYERNLHWATISTKKSLRTWQSTIISF